MKHENFTDWPDARIGRRLAFHRYVTRGKRVLDVAGVLVLAPVAVPLVAVLWGAVRLDGGPGFFGHDRVGREATQFRCWKLRTMCVDAPARLRAHLKRDPGAAREWAQNYKLKDDPRVTRLGRILRKTSLDELPQLWNVLRGEMSLVGPRPVPEAELEEYRGFEWAYLMCRPGITGVWQVSGRNDVSYAERVKMDVGYVLNARLRTDLEVLWKTIGAVVKRTGC